MSSFNIVSELGYDLVMDVKGGDTSANTFVISYQRHASNPNNQLWKDELLGDKTFKLIPKINEEMRLAIRVSADINMLKLVIMINFASYTEW